MREFHSPQRVVYKIDRNSSDVRARAAQLETSLGLSPIVATLCVGRSYDLPEAAQSYLYPSLRDHLPDPATMKGMTDGVALLLDSIRAKRHITIYSDFDVDGVSSSAQLLLVLRRLGARVNAFVPNRFREGYGVTMEAVERLIKGGTELLVTLDCGISNVAEMEYARSKGVDTIIIDHHYPHSLPPASVIINPAQEGCPFGRFALASAGIVWMLLIALRRQCADSGFNAETFDPKEFLDLAALGTVCDMVPLVELNRLIAFRGVEALRRTSRQGIIELCRAAGIPALGQLTCGHLGFALGPRINASGRIGDATDVLELLTTAQTDRARQLAHDVDRLNEKRRSLEEQVKKACLEDLEARGSYADEPAFCFYRPEFHLGVVGIVAQRLVQQLRRPVAVMGLGETVVDGKRIPAIRGSIRSIRGFHVAERLQACEEFLLGYGGHAEAGGLTVLPEKLEAFSKAFVAEAGRVLSAEHFERVCRADMQLSLKEIDFKLAQDIGHLAPFGVGNPAPLFVAEGVGVESTSVVGDNHIKLRLAEGKTVVPAVCWNGRGHPLIIPGNRISVAYHLEINSYRGLSSVQLNVQDVWAG